VAKELAEDLDDEPWEGDFNLTGPTKNDSYGGYLKSDIVLPAGIELATTTGFDAYDRFNDIDLDMSPETLFHITTDDEAWQVYQDLSLSGDLVETGFFRWALGGWVLREELDVEVANDFGTTAAASVGVGGRDYLQNTTSAGGFGSFGFDFWEDFTLDGGVRYNWEQKRLDMAIAGGGFAIDTQGCARRGGVQSTTVDCRLDDTWNASTGTIRLSYRFREDTQVSWKYTRGWKPGSYNATASQFTGPSIADPEELDAFEMGLRGAWFQGRIGLDASLFYYQYKDYQIFTAQQFLGGTPEFVILNANDAEVYGSEIDATARPWGGAFWNVRFSWLESQFLDFQRRDQFLRSGGAGGSVVFRDAQNSGNSLLNSPEFKVSLTAEQTIPLDRYGSLTARYDGVWTATTFYDASAGKGLGDLDGVQFLPDDTIAQQPFWLHNARVSWRAPGGRFELAGWVRNIEDKAYKTFAFDGSTFQATTIYFVGDPRTYGLSATVTFF
jgi:iron complex outermembrane receptor protein